MVKPEIQYLMDGGQSSSKLGQGYCGSIADCCCHICFDVCQGFTHCWLIRIRHPSFIPASPQQEKHMRNRRPTPALEILDTSKSGERSFSKRQVSKPFKKGWFSFGWSKEQG